MQLVTGVDPSSPEWLAARRAAVLDFISAALFLPASGNQPNQKRFTNVGRGERK
jgi:hypothetical protein